MRNEQLLGQQKNEKGGEIPSICSLILGCLVRVSGGPVRKKILMRRQTKRKQKQKQKTKPKKGGKVQHHRKERAEFQRTLLSLF